MNDKEIKATLNNIELAKYPLLFVPFHGTPVCVKLRELTQAQIMACGNFSLIETLEDKIAMNKNRCRPRDIIAYAERNYAIVKTALVCPTYDQIFEVIGKDLKVEETKKELEQLKIKLQEERKGPKRSALEEEIDCLMIHCHFLLPNDFVSYIVSYSLGVDKSDIKTITKNMLIESAILAKKGHDNPADHIDGNFTAFNRHDINIRAWLFLAEKENNKIA